MNPLRWTIFKTGDNRDKGKVIDPPSVKVLEQFEHEGYHWVNRGQNLEPIGTVVMDLIDSAMRWDGVTEDIDGKVCGKLIPALNHPCFLPPHDGECGTHYDD